jgi:hypothetical protein
MFLRNIEVSQDYKVLEHTRPHCSREEQNSEEEQTEVLLYVKFK